MNQARLATLVRNVVLKGSTIDGTRVDLEDVESGTGRLCGLVPTHHGDGLLAQPGDVLFGKLRPYLRKSLRVEQPTACSPEFLVLRPEPHVEPRYLAYVVQSDAFIEAAVASTDGVKMPRTSFEKLRAIRIVLPGRGAQRAVADYLDAETARLDAVVEARQRMIELLDERWSALRRRLTGVSQPYVPRASIQLRRIARLQAGAAFPHDHQGDESGTIPYIKVGDLANVDEDDRIVKVANRVAPSVAKELRSPILPAGAIVLPKIGAALLNNRRAVLIEASCLDQNVMGVTVTSGNPEYVYHCLAATDLGDLSTPGPLPLLNEEAAKSLRIPWPPIADQSSAVEAIRDNRREVLAPVRPIRRQIALLRERRQALITTAVTGKLQAPDAPVPNALA